MSGLLAGAEAGRGAPGPPGVVAPGGSVGGALLTLLGPGADEDAVCHLLVDRPDSEPDGFTGPFSGSAVTARRPAGHDRGGHRRGDP
ncbi:hypothetical protein [Streptomyces gelaticus]|uniref:hypothetical protein n=1 Tax=Streptomyces gelaticus TaxID=285446 RepID=UPI001675B59F|nr:hypothetical protein [Streptomyces gelaticus]